MNNDLEDAFEAAYRRWDLKATRKIARRMVVHRAIVPVSLWDEPADRLLHYVGKHYIKVIPQWVLAKILPISHWTILKAGEDPYEFIKRNVGMWWYLKTFGPPHYHDAICACERYYN